MRRAYPNKEVDVTMLTTDQPLTIKRYLKRQGVEEHRRKIIKGLNSENKYIPSMYFYDEAGSELFEAITRLPEYYPPQKEMPLLETIANELRDDWIDLDIVELGSGDCSKISILLSSVPEHLRSTIRYLPFDVSEEAIEKSSELLLKTFPNLQIQGLVADFQTQLHFIPNERKRVFCFFGSTIGNLSEKQARAFIADLSNIMVPGERFLLSFDMVKDKRVIEKAYNDSQEVTAKFNLNILNVVNTYLHSDFDSDDFEHLAFYNEAHSRIEMHLKAKNDVRIASPFLNDPIKIEKDETIHTENSQKFTRASIRELAAAGHFDIQNTYTDNDEWFSIVQFTK